MMTRRFLLPILALLALSAAGCSSDPYANPLANAWGCYWDGDQCNVQSTGPNWRCTAVDGSGRQWTAEAAANMTAADGARQACTAGSDNPASCRAVSADCERSG